MKQAKEYIVHLESIDQHSFAISSYCVGFAIGAYVDFYSWFDHCNPFRLFHVQQSTARKWDL